MKSRSGIKLRIPDFSVDSLSLSKAKFIPPYTQNFKQIVTECGSVYLSSAILIYRGTSSVISENNTQCN